MNRRRFLELLGQAALGSGIVYSFPSVIVPRNIQTVITPICWSDQLTFRISDDNNFGFGFFDVSGPRHFISKDNTIFEFDGSVLNRIDQETINRLQLYVNV